MNSQLILDQAVALQKSGRVAEAELLYLDLITADPDNFRAQNSLGIIRFQQGRYAEALALIGACLKSNSSAETLSNYGNVLQALGRLDEAVESYDKALAIEPRLVNALYNRGVTLSNMKRMADALASYDKALEIAPDDADIWMNRVHALIDLNRPLEALAAAEKLLALAPHYAEAWNNRGIALQALARFEEAFGELRKSLGDKTRLCRSAFQSRQRPATSGARRGGAGQFQPGRGDKPGFCRSLV